MTSFSTTGTISSAGIGSGLDVDGIVTKLMAIEKRPLTLLQGTASDIQTKISAYGSLQSAESAFRDAALALATATTWTNTTASSSDASSVAATTTTGAAASNYSIVVQSLATAQSVATTAYTGSTALVGAGTLHIDVGSWTTAPASFSARADSTGVDITVSATDTLANVRDKINAAGAGVSASIVNDATGSRLVMTSSATGIDNGFRVHSADAIGATGLSGLAYDPQAGEPLTSLTQSGANSAVVINGLSVNSASNTLSDVVEGLTLTLSKLTTGPVQIGVAQDSAKTRQSIQGFVTAYNTLASALAKNTKYDPTSKAAGALQGDSTAVSLQRQLRNMLGANSGASSVFSTLSQAGLEMQQDGSLKINDTKLAAAMGNMGELQQLFARNDTVGEGANDGIAVRLRKFGDAVLGTGGMLTTRTEGLTRSLSVNSKSQDAMTDRLAATEARMRAQYSALDTKMASLSALSTYMTQQIALWNKSTN